MRSGIELGQPQDGYEREADRVADEILRVSAPSRPGARIQPRVQRKCMECETDRLDRAAESGRPGGAGFAPAPLAQRVRRFRGGGSQLAREERAYMEPRFGHDLSRVRVHSSGPAARLASDLSARAFTLGSDVFFGPGEYAPQTPRGRRLLAHELTHVVQQSGGSPLASGASSTSASARRITRSTSSERLQRAMICSKRLEAPVVGWIANHAFIDDTGRNDCLGSGLSGNYAIQTLASGNFLKGCAAKTDRSSDPMGRSPNVKACRPKAGVTNVSACLRNAYNSYSDPSEYRNPRGPNSNTFAFTLANACCADSNSSGLGIVPGWGRSPAPPCDLTTPDFGEPEHLGGGAIRGRDGIIRQGPGPKL